MEDRSLDEFLDTGSDDDGDPSEEEPPDSDLDGADSSGASTEEQSATDATDETSASDPPENGDTSTEPSDESQSTGEPSLEPAVTYDVEPAVSTFVRVPDGDSCAACGATVERRWHSEDGLVCADCKEW